MHKKNHPAEAGWFRLSKKSAFVIVGDGVLDVPAAEPCVFFADFRQIRNISLRVVQEADPYI